VIVLGPHIYPAGGDAAAPLRRAPAAWTSLPDVTLVNLQFADDASASVHPAFETARVLRQDSRTVARVDGPRKPIVREMLDRLVERAEAAGASYAGFSNADIIVSPAAMARGAAGRHDAVIFSRMGVDAATGSPLGEFVSGQDTLFIRPAAYRRVRAHLRPYIVGEMPWDVIYTSVLLTHLRAELVNRGDECRHVDHDTIWVDSPFAAYGWRLAYMDWTYFARWYRYYYGVLEIRARGGTLAEEEAWRDGVFGPLTLGERAKNVYRRVRYGGLRGDAP
jgi:hypothetical protein